MKNILPGFIVDKLKRKKYSGRLKASVLYLDISGFTRITEKLMLKGSEGAEILSDMLEGIYDPLAGIVYSYGGFIAGFEGDSFTAVFPGDREKAVLKAGFDMKGIIGSLEGSINAKICFSTGIFEWHIFRHREFYHYYFRGSAFEKVFKLAKKAKKGDILTDSAGLDKYSVCEIKSRALRILDIKPFSVEKIRYRSEPPSGEILSRFFPEEIIDFPRGEFRDLTAVFISFDLMENPQDIYRTIIDYQERYGGSKPRFFSGDKGSCALVFFGSPVSYEDNEIRAANFIQGIRKEIPVKAGIATGIVYTGFYGSRLRSEFSCLGSKINLASRLMVMCPAGRVYLDEETAKRINRHFASEYAGHRTAKGFGKKIAVYELADRNPDTQYPSGLFFGRHKELKKLKEGIRKALANGTGAVWLVTGDIGAGKTSFVRALRERLKEAKWVAMECSSIDSMPFQPLRQMLDEYFGHKDREKNFIRIYDNLINSQIDGELRDELKKARPFIAFLMDIDLARGDITALDPNIRYESIIHSLRAFILARGLPLVLWVDNAHLLDSDTLYFLDFFCRSGGGRRFALIISGRDSMKGHAFQSTFRKMYSEIRLGGLGRDDSRRLAEAVLSCECSEETLDHIYAKSEGNPLFLEYLASYIKGNNLLDGDRNLKKGELEIPGSIQSIILSQIDKLSKSLRDSIKNASVLGYRFESGILLSMLLKQNIGDEELLREGVKKKVWRPVSLIVYLFTNALIRDTVYRVQLKRELKRLHDIAAESFINTCGDNPAYYNEIASHLETAGRYEDAIGYYRKASNYYKEGISYKEALKCIKKALELLIAIRADEEILIRTIDAAMSLMNFNGLYRECTALYREHESIIRESEDYKTVCRILLSVSYCHNITNDIEDGERLIEEALKTADEKEDKRLMSAIYSSRAVNYMFRHRVDEALDCFDKSAVLDPENRDDVNLATIYLYKGKYEKAKIYLDRYQDMVSKSGSKYLLVHFLELSARYYINAERNYEKALEQAEKAREILKDFYFSYGSIKTGFIIVEILQREGRYREALELAIQTEKLSVETGYTEGLCYSSYMTGLLSIAVNDYDTAEKYLKKALKLSRKACIIDYVNDCMFYLCILYALQGRYRNGARTLTGMIAFLKETDQDNTFIEDCRLLRRICVILDKAEENTVPAKLHGLKEQIKGIEELSMADFLIYRRYGEYAGGIKASLIERYKSIKPGRDGILYDLLLSCLEQGTG